MPKRTSPQAFKGARNAAYTQGNTAYTSSATGKMSTNGRTAGGSTQAFSRSRGGKLGRRGNLATRRQRYYDVRVGLGLSGG